MKKEKTKSEQDTKSAENENASPENEPAQLSEQEQAFLQLAEKCEEYADKYARLAAEYDNFRKRTIKEREQIKAKALSDAALKLLPVLDNLDRAMPLINSEKDSPLKQGVELIAKSLNDAFEKIGITKIPAENETFDPNLHEAVMHVDDDSAGDGIIVEELQAGYMLGETVIRHSMVKVAN